MLKRRKREKANIRQDAAVRSIPHMKWVRGFACAAREQDCSDRMEVHHVRLGSHTGMAQKPGDDQVVPLCSYHHTSLHVLGQETFARRYKVDLSKLAAQLWQRSPARIKRERKESRP